MPRIRTAALVTVVGVSAAMLAFAGPASAHVTVASTDAKAGGFGVVTFRMPNEEAKATTTRLQVQLPSATPLAFVATQPMTGWAATVTKSKLAKPIATDDGDVSTAATSITWVADKAAAVKPGEFQLFNVEMGPLPKTSSVTFPAIQTYSDGTVVKWVERQAPGSTTEPDHPAPVLQLTGAAHTTPDAPSVSSSPAAAAAPAKSSSNTGPIVLSIIALVLAAGALGLAVVSRARRSA